MNIYLARNEDISESFLIKLLDLLKSLTGSFKFRHIAEPIKLGQGKFFEWKEMEDFFISDYEEDFLAMNNEIKMSSKKRTEYFTWEAIFKEIFRFRSKYVEKDGDLIFLFTAKGNHANWTSTCDFNLRNFYVQTSYWEDFFDDEYLDSYYPIAFEVLSWIFRSFMLKDTNELKDALHLSPSGCIMDFCRNKREVTIKMRTADLCKECSVYAKEKGVSIPITVDIFGGLEKIRLYLNYVNRLEYLQKPRKLVVKDRLQYITIPDILGDLCVPLKPKERAVYLFFLSLPEGIFLSELPIYRKKLFHYYALISGLADRKTQESVVNRLIENQLQYELSNIRKEFKALLGKKLADYYTIEGQRGGRYKINLGLELIEYRNNLPLQL